MNLSNGMRLLSFRVPGVNIIQLLLINDILSVIKVKSRRVGGGSLFVTHTYPSQLLRVSYLGSRGIPTCKERVG